MTPAEKNLLDIARSFTELPAKTRAAASTCRCQRLAFPHRRDRNCDEFEDRLYEDPPHGIDREPTEREIFDAREARAINRDNS